MVAVEQATAVSDELAEALERLLPQLSSSAAGLSLDELEEILASPATAVVVARDAEGRIVGSLTLAVFRIPTGMRAWIEDVVVDEDSRGQGVGDALVRSALDLARDAGARTVDLTSRPSREAAARLYTKLGFGRRETDVYRLEL